MPSKSRVVLALSLLFFLTAGLASAHSSVSPAMEAPSTIYRMTVPVEDLDELRRQHDVWAYYPLTSEAILPLDDETRDRLKAEGVFLELDEERTRALKQGAVNRRKAEASGNLGGGIPGFSCYRTVEETYADLAAAAAARPTLAQWLDIGDSWEKTMGMGGYDHHVLVLTNQSITDPKPAFVLMAAMHAREYTTAELATRYALHLLNGYGTDPEATWLLDHREIHVIPQQNPDGRKQAESGISWRKNTNNDFCSNDNLRGIDLNRNSTFFWGGGASSGSQCSELFRGPSVASEPETQTIEDYLAQVFPDQKGDMDDPAPGDAEGVFISLHSFGELVLFSWEGTNADSPNHDGMQTLGRRFGFYNDYSVCQDCLGTASGTTPDVAYGEYGVPSYTFELGNSFFEGCSNFENTIYPDNLPALIYAAKVADRPYQKASGPDALNLQVSSMSVTAGQPVDVTATVDDTRFDSNGFGNEPVQNIASARVGFDLSALDSGGGTAMTAVDGTFDSTQEAVTAQLDTTGLGPGQHLIYVVGTDASGAQGPPGAIFLEVTVSDVIFEDGFEDGTTGAW